MQADFEGFYARFETYTKKDAGILMGADVLVGDEFNIKFEQEETGTKAAIYDKFDKRVGYFEEATTRQLRLYEARGWTVRVILAFLAYSDHPEPGCYWGQMAVLAYPSECNELFEKFVGKVAAKLADGKRVDVNIGNQGIKSLVETNGEWFTSATLPKVKFDAGTVMMKSSRSLSEKLVEQGRAKNPGCYIVSWVFIIGIVALIIVGLRSCGAF